MQVSYTYKNNPEIPSGLTDFLLNINYLALYVTYILIISVLHINSKRLL